MRFFRGLFPVCVRPFVFGSVGSETMSAQMTQSVIDKISDEWPCDYKRKLMPQSIEVDGRKGNPLGDCYQFGRSSERLQAWTLKPHSCTPWISAGVLERSREKNMNSYRGRLRRLIREIGG